MVWSPGAAAPPATAIPKLVALKTCWIPAAQRRKRVQVSGDGAKQDLGLEILIVSVETDQIVQIDGSGRVLESGRAIERFRRSRRVGRSALRSAVFGVI